MSIVNTRQDEIVEEFSVFDDWMDKYAYIIDLGKDLNSLDESRITSYNVCYTKLLRSCIYREKYHILPDRLVLRPG